MTVTMNGTIVYGKEYICKPCGWHGSHSAVKSIAGFEFCPRCDRRYFDGLMPSRFIDDRNPCAVCGMSFTEDEWEERHSTAEGDDCHEHCCLECSA